MCQRYNLAHYPEIKRNEFGTPFVNSIFEEAEKIAKFNMMCYVNADIILMSDFMTTVRLVDEKKKNYLLIGQRWDVNIRELLDFSEHWESKLNEYVKQEGQLHPATGKDYFCFRKGIFQKIPPFALGRGTWDSWLVYYARKRKMPVVDLTKATSVIHQNHGYEHIVKKDNNDVSDWKGHEFLINRSLVGKYFGGENTSYTIEDANYVVNHDRIVKRSEHYLLKRSIIHFLSPFYMFFKNRVRNVSMKIRDPHQ